MEIVLPKPGSYVVAVSGGVDSMALLHMLYMEALKDRDWKMTVAHLDHGMRSNSAEDRKLVQAIARQYDLPFVYKEAWLGEGASEAAARKVRYMFLGTVARASGAEAVITAHHQDDVLETAIINMLRGTKRKGLTALSSRDGLVRPLLQVTKAELISYAQQQGLDWHEDETNIDVNYLRNYVRHNLLPQFDEAKRKKLLGHIDNLSKVNTELDDLLMDNIDEHLSDNGLNRSWFNQLPHEVAREVLASWLRANDIRGFDSKTLERLVVAAKVSKSGKSYPIQLGYNLSINKASLALVMPER